MKQLLSHPGFYLLLAFVLLIIVPMSTVGELWATAIIAFIAGLLALGWDKSPPVLAWVIAINMLTIFADITLIELNNADWVYIGLEPKLPDAITRSSCAIAFLAIGMRCGLLVGQKWFGYPVVVSQDHEEAAPYPALRITAVYFAFLPVSALLASLGNTMPGLIQQIYVFGLLKFVLIYMLAAVVIASKRNGYLLFIVIATEIVLGSVSGWSSYKEGFFVVLIALAASSRRFTLGNILGAITGTAMIIYLSLAWSAVKAEFRSTVDRSDIQTALAWVAGKYFNGDIDFAAATVALLDRVGYNKFYAAVLNADTDALQGIYLRALLHVVTPRILFPEKEILDDSLQTAQAIGLRIEKNTSIGLGYIAQAQIDFGFPGLLLPMIVLGAILGSIYAYFLTRSTPRLIREAFAVACLFNSLQFAGNIDKQFGFMIMTLLVFAFILRFGGAFLHWWLADSPVAMQGRTY
jgi:hypothetical protein